MPLCRGGLAGGRGGEGIGGGQVGRRKKKKKKRALHSHLGVLKNQPPIPRWRWAPRGLPAWASTRAEHGGAGEKCRPLCGRVRNECEMNGRSRKRFSFFCFPSSDTRAQQASPPLLGPCTVPVCGWCVSPNMPPATRRSTRPPPTSFALFWPFYLREHARPSTRVIHVAGTLAAATLAALSATHHWGWRGTVASAVAGYGPAWCSHFFIEGNRPASFRRPLLSFAADLRMAGLALTGRLGPHLAAAGVVAK